MPKEEINMLLKSFSQRPIAYQKIYAQITGSVTAGLLLSQIVYWFYAVGEREFYKTDKEFRDELAMGPREFKTAKSKLKKLELAKITVKGIPAKTYYIFEETELLARIYSWAETHQLVESKCTKRKGQNAPANSKTKARDHAESTKKQEKEVSPENILGLDCLIKEKVNLLAQQLNLIFHPNSRERRTFSNIIAYFVSQTLMDEQKICWFTDAIEWARIARVEGRKAGGKALFVQTVKERTGFGRNPKLLSGKSHEDYLARASPVA